MDDPKGHNLHRHPASGKGETGNRNRVGCESDISDRIAQIGTRAGGRQENDFVNNQAT